MINRGEVVANVTIWLAFGAGIFSFVSPCCLSLYPSYISYITGVSVSQLQDSQQSSKIKTLTMIHTLFFIIGFSIIFFALGLSASWIGQLFIGNQKLISMLGGFLVIILGLFVMGVIKPTWLMREKKWSAGRKPTGYLGSTLVGIGFAAGWTPCVGPILASVLVLSASNPSQGLIYITAYTLGFAIPFFVMAFFIGRTKWIVKYSSKFMKIGGVIMVITGFLLYTGQMTKITTILIDLFGGFTGF
ncbi:cytochrome c biogenesis CcdA family protein [Oceanobacillus sp. CAU 1775]